MRAARQRSPQVAVRVRWVVALLATMALVGAGGYVAYRYRWQQNTLRLLSDARNARDAQDWDSAATSYRYYVRRNPADYKALDEFVDVLLERAKKSPETLRDAVPALQRLVKVKPADVEPVLKLTNLYLELGEASMAAEFAHRWCELEPASVEAVLAAARADFGSRRTAQAAELLKQASTRFPNEARFYPPLIEILNEELDRPHEAEEWLRKALEAAPNSVDVQTVAFAFYQAQDNPRQAEVHLQKSLELSPDSAEVLARGAMFYLNRGDISKSTELLQRGIAIDPQHRMILSVRAARAIRTNDIADLVATAQSLESAARKNEPEKIAQAAELYLRAGDLSRAEVAMDKLATKAGLSSALDVWLDTLRGARHLLSEKPYTAIPLLERSLRKQPSGIWPMELLALSYRQIGGLDEAASLYRRIVALSPHSAGARLALAQVELELGNCGEAMEQLQLLPPMEPKAQALVSLISLACDLKDKSIQASSMKSEDVKRKLAELTASPPRDAPAMQILLQCLVYANEPEKAEELARAFEAPGASKAATMFQLGRTLLKEKRSDMAVRWAEELTKKNPEYSEGHALLVEALAAHGDLLGAAKHVGSDQIPTTAQSGALAALGEIHLRDGRTDEGLGSLRKAAAVDQQNVKVRQILARFVPTLEEAQRYCEEIRKVEGDDGLQWKYELAGALLQRDPSKQAATQALELVKACLAVRPNWTPARLLMAYAQERTGALADAADSYRTAFTQQPELARQPVALRYVEILKSLGQSHEADLAVSQLVAALPDSPEVMRLEVERQVRGRNLNAAALVAERLLALRPDDPGWVVATADLHLRAGNPKRAEELAREELRKSPDSISILRSLARAFIAQGRSEEARELLRTTAETTKNPVVYVLLAELHSQSGDLPGAEQAIKIALEKAPDDANVLIAAAEFFGARRNLPRQLELVRKALTTRGEDASVALSLATLLAGGDAAQREEAAAIVRRRLEANPREVPALLVEAHLLTTATPPNLPSAESTLKKAIHADPQDPRPAKVLASLQARAGRASDAAETLSNALAVQPDDPELLLSIAEINIIRGNPQPAFSALRRLLEFRPRHPDAQRLQVEACRQTGQLEPCVTHLEGVAEGQRTSTENMLLGVLYDLRRDPRRAEELFRAAVKADERNGQAYQALTQWLASHDRCSDLYTLASERRERFADDVGSTAVAAELMCSRCTEPELRRTGIQWLEEIARQQHENAADASYRAGLCHYLSGDLVSAETMFLKATTLNPSAVRPVNALAWLYSEDRSQPERALDLIESFLAQGGIASAEMFDTQAAAMIQLRRFEIARQKLAACLELAGSSPTRTAATYRMGLLRMQTDDENEGRAYIRQALELDSRLGGLTPKEKREAARLLSTGS